MCPSLVIPAEGFEFCVLLQSWMDFSRIFLSDSMILVLIQTLLMEMLKSRTVGIHIPSFLPIIPESAFSLLDFCWMINHFPTRYFCQRLQLGQDLENTNSWQPNSLRYLPS